MSGFRRTLLIALAIGVATAFPAPMAFAQDRSTDDRGALDAPPGAPAHLCGRGRAVDSKDALDAPPDAPPPTDPWAMDAPVDEAPAIAPAQPQGRRPSGIAERLAGWVTATGDNGELPLHCSSTKSGRTSSPLTRAASSSAPRRCWSGSRAGTTRRQGSATSSSPRSARTSARPRPAGSWLGSVTRTATALCFGSTSAMRSRCTAVMSVNPGRHRLPGIHSSDPSRHRISYGCINVPATFYDDVVLTALASGNAAVVYILPDTKAIDDVFPAFAAAGGRRPRRASRRART